ncbi:MAG: phage tail tube protein [Cetobacterium sp.]
MGYRNTKDMRANYIQVWWNGSKLWDLKSIDLSIDVEREEISVAGTLGKDSLVIGLTGSGSITTSHRYTKVDTLLKSIKAGKEERVEIVVEVKDPNNNRETVKVPVWFNNLPIFSGEEAGSRIEKSYDIGFNADDLVFLDVARLKEDTNFTISL